MWQRFTERARRVVFSAQEEAQSSGEGHVSTEHLLLGLVREEGSVAIRVLEALGVSLDMVRKHVREYHPKEVASPGKQMTLTPTAKTVIDLAYDEARNLNNNYIGTEHLLLGMIRDGIGVAGRVLEEIGVQLESTRQTVQAIQIAELGGEQVAGLELVRWAEFSGHSRGVVAEAVSGALRRSQGPVMPGHLVEALLGPDVGLEGMLAAMGIEQGPALASVTMALDEAALAPNLALGLASRSRAALQEASGERRRMGADLVEPHHILLGLALGRCLAELGLEADVEAGRRFVEDFG